MLILPLAPPMRKSRSVRIAFQIYVATITFGLGRMKAPARSRRGRSRRDATALGFGLGRGHHGRWSLIGPGRLTPQAHLHARLEGIHVGVNDGRDVEREQ